MPQSPASQASSATPPSERNQSNKDSRRYYFGVFTNKGGTGKTVVAAHLAGAFALMGYDVILIDIDPQRNLKKLFQNDGDREDSSLFVPALRPGQAGSVISVLDEAEWEDDKDNHDEKIIICDCNPTLSENSTALVQEFDYCIIPTTLNPLGISRNSDVVKRTFEQVRNANSKTEIHALINCYANDQSTKKRNNMLLRLLEKQTNFDEGRKFHLIDPGSCAIHYSKSLYYWGMHIVEEKKPELAFTGHGGKCVPREDFLELASYFMKRMQT